VTQLRAALPADSVIVKAVIKAFEALGDELEDDDSDLFDPEDADFALLR
jgi:hypothetical protein